MKQLPTQSCNCFAAIAMVVDRVGPDTRRAEPGATLAQTG